MKTAMIFPTNESEKAINRYSETLTREIRNYDNINDINYTAGKPFTLFNQCKYIRSHDIVHVQHEYNLLGKFGIPFFMLYSRLFLSKVKVITTMHTVLSLNEKFSSGKLKTFLRKMLYRVQNRFINWTNHKVIVHAQFFKDILINEYGFKEDKIQVIPQAILEDVPMIDKEEAKKKFNLKGPVYLIIGSFVPDHGADLIIKRAKEINGTILIVANPVAVNDRNEKRIDSFLEENIQYVKDNDIKNVRFDIKPITDTSPDWWNYFSAADLVLLPYRGGIGSGILAHSMAARRPVVASDIKFFNEISENFNCLEVTYNDEYPKTIEDSMSNIRGMSISCDMYKQNFGMSQVAKLYSTLYNDVHFSK